MMQNARADLPALTLFERAGALEIETCDNERKFKPITEKEMLKFSK